MSLISNIGCVALPWHFEFYILKCKNFLIDFLDELDNFKPKKYYTSNCKILLHYTAIDPEYSISIPLLRDFFRDFKQIGNTLGDLLNLTLKFWITLKKNRWLYPDIFNDNFNWKHTNGKIMSRKVQQSSLWHNFKTLRFFET